MRLKNQLNLPVMPLHDLSPGDDASETARKNLSDWQTLPGVALGRCGMSQKHAALTIDISESLLSRQLKGTEKLGWFDLGKLPRTFWGELIPMLADWHDLSFGVNERAREDAVLGAKAREFFQLLRGER